MINLIYCLLLSHSPTNGCLIYLPVANFLSKFFWFCFPPSSHHHISQSVILHQTMLRCLNIVTTNHIGKLSSFLFSRTIWNPGHTIRIFWTRRILKCRHGWRPAECCCPCLPLNFLINVRINDVAYVSCPVSLWQVCSVLKEYLSLRF